MNHSEEINIIVEKSIPLADWMIKENGSIVLQEKTITQYQNIRIYTNSNELTSHHRPHVHVDVNDKSYQIAIDDSFDVLSFNEDKFARFVIKTFLSKNLNEYRKAWNEIQSNYKFIIDNTGNYLCK